MSNQIASMVCNGTLEWGQDVLPRPFSRLGLTVSPHQVEPARLMRMRREVLGPRFALAASLPSAFRDEPFTVEQKDFFAVGQLPHIFSHVAIAPADADILYAYNDPLRRLSHGNDGIIFTPARDPYRPYTCPTLLKWKPANMNSIDFRLQTKWRREGDKPAPQPS